MKREKTCQWINTSEKLKERSTISCGKDTNNHSLKLAQVFSQKPITFKADALLYSNDSHYSGATKLYNITN